ncbi:hypothetical protein CYY_002328 [Polysphondylium violaceum]|uniref:GB1/RHD3-type G domain-containing protein n=1 Tax=Polysphondylium violaceum TaxID=133409 RepID=A0A8J4PYL9_9MYCE|nr:hypothetical protein CYY_002328 [Polysphondylium violaceum]
MIKFFYNNNNILSICFTLYILLVSITTCYTASTTGDKLIENENFKELIQPIQLIYPDKDHQRLLINETSMNILNSLIDYDLSILGVVGTFHSGKSFLLNQLLDTTDRFTVGPTVHPETMGIWVWASKVRYAGKLHNLLLLDTEGFYSSNVSETYDAKIFAITTLLSSHLIYNSVKIIDQSALEYLELLSRRTQLFALKSQMKSESLQSQKKQQSTITDIKATDHIDSLLQILQFPSLTWVVQDFFQDIGGITATQWLHNLLKAHSRDSDSNLSIGEIFPSIECHTLFIPSGDRDTLRYLNRAKMSDLNPTYIRELNQLKHSLFNSLKPKLSGPAFGTLLRLLVDVANGNKFPTVPSIWSGFIKQQQQNALEDSITGYKEKISLFKTVDPPFNQDQFLELEKNSFNYANELYKQLLFGLEEAYNPGLITLHTLLKELFVLFSKENQNRIKTFNQKIYQDSFLDFQKKVEGIEIPISSKQLLSLLDSFKFESILQYKKGTDLFKLSESFDYFMGMLENDMVRVSASKQNQNTKELELLLTKAVAVVCEKYKSDMAQIKYPIPIAELKIKHKELFKESEQTFKKIASISSQENSYYAYHAMFEKNISELHDKVFGHNEMAIREKCKQETNRCVYDFKKSASQILLPVEEDYLQKNLEQYKAKSIQLFKNSLVIFDNSDAYKEEFINLQVKLEQQIDLKNKENVEQMKLIVMEYLNTVKVMMKSRYSSYWFQYSFENEAHQEADKRISQKIQSKSLRDKVIKQFIETDLKDEMNSLFKLSTLIITLSIGVLIILVISLYSRSS